MLPSAAAEELFHYIYGPISGGRPTSPCHYVPTDWYIEQATVFPRLTLTITSLLFNQPLILIATELQAVCGAS